MCELLEFQGRRGSGGRRWGAEERRGSRGGFICVYLCLNPLLTIIAEREMEGKLFCAPFLFNTSLDR